MAGRRGSARAPGAATSTSAVTSPPVVAMRQRAAVSSHAASVTSWPNRMRGVTPNRPATSSRYARISGWRA